MSVQSQTPLKKQDHRSAETPHERNAGPLILIGLGVLLLLATWIRLSDPGIWLLPLMGLLFVGVAVYTRESGFLVPGAILGSLGVGLILAQRLLQLDDLPLAGVIVLSMAVGFALITVFGPLVEPGRHYWALFPAAILGVIGLLLLVGPWGVSLLQALGSLWPGVLIAIGVAWLWVSRRRA